MVAHAQEIGGVVGENLRRALPWLPQAKKLLTVYCEVPLPVKPEDLAPQPRGEAELTGLFQRFGFKSWLKEPAETGTPASEAAPPATAQTKTEPIARHYDTLFDEQQMAEWLKLLDSGALVAFDTETTGLDPLTAQLVGMSFCAEPGRAAYLPLAHNYAGAPHQLGVARALELLRPWLEDAAKPKLGQNLKYDQHVLANYGVRLRGVAHDTLLESYVLESHLRHDLGTLAERHLHLETISYDDVTGKGAQRIGFEQVSVERATEYSAEDADVTLRVHQCLYPQVQAEAGLEYVYRRIELPAREVLFRMERTGVLIDAALLEAQSRELGQKMMELEHKAYSEAGQPFNLNSPKQIGEIFFQRLQLPVLKKTPSGAPSTDEEVLERLAADYPLPKTLLDYRALTKLKSTYTDKLPRMVNPATGRVHTNYAQATAVTGRLASTDPNLQNIPVRTAGRAPHPRGLHRAARLRHRLGRLLANRIAHHGAHLARRKPAARFRRGRGRAPRHRRGNLQPRAARGHA